MGISKFDFMQMQARLSHNQLRDPREPFESAERETGKSGLQSQIMEWCDEQWPRWVVLRAATYRKSTLEVGTHDLTIFGSGRRCFLVEVKAKGNKPSERQLIWAAQLAPLGWKVEFVWSYEQFLEIVK